MRKHILSLRPKVMGIILYLKLLGTLNVKAQTNINCVNYVVVAMFFRSLIYWTKLIKVVIASSQVEEIQDIIK